MFKNIPKHWNINPLSFPEISTIIMGQSPSSNTYNDTQEGLPFFKEKQISVIFHQLQEYGVVNL